jgi:thiamine pyrophosphate-dependent acetolactate synthase large subunit-like protein
MAPAATGLVEFDSFVRHGIPVIAVVGNDAGWTQIAREQVKMLHDDVGTVLARTDYHEVARASAPKASWCARPTRCPPPWPRPGRWRAGRPVLVNVWLDKTEFREGSLSM